MFSIIDPLILDFICFVGGGTGKRGKGCQHPYVLCPQTRSAALHNEGSGQPWVGHPAGCYQLLQWVCIGCIQS